MSPIFAIPTTTVVKMIGAIIILISLTKPSPSGRISVPHSGLRYPRSTPITMATTTWKYSERYNGLRCLAMESLLGLRTS